MKTRSITALFSVLVLGAATPVFADDNPTGLPDNPNTNENVIPGPAATGPTDPAASDSARARVPTDENLAEELKADKRQEKHKESTKY